MGVFQKGLSEHLTDITVAAFTDAGEPVVVLELAEKYVDAIDSALTLLRMDLNNAAKHLIEGATALANKSYEDAKVSIALAAKALEETYDSIAPHNPPPATTAQAGASNDGASAEAGSSGESEESAPALAPEEPSPSDQKEESSSAPAATDGSTSTDENNTAGEYAAASSAADSSTEKQAASDEGAA